MAKRPARPRDPNVLAKLVVDIATGEAKNIKPARATARRKGGVKGGRARADQLTPEQRREIAKVAARARWKK
jgi:hypothetical protein